jgi:undecaprenyl-diphosphatase
MSALNWIQQYPVLSLIFVFAIAFGESLALVGMIVPGAILMVSFGALIATDLLSFWPTVLVAFLGAVMGDGLSYYLGARYQRHLAQIWPLSRHPDLLPQGEKFFKQHGAKSVLLGRFFGPLRAIIPAIAGMMGMSRRQFFIVNILSAALWAPVYLLPGIIFAASLELASEMTARIALFMLIVLVVFLIFAWLVKHTYLKLTPQLERYILKLIRWIDHHPHIGKVPGSIINPQQSDILGLSVLGFILFFGVASVSLLLQRLAYWPLLSNLNLMVSTLVEKLHHPLLDNIMQATSALGSFYLLITVFVLFVLWKIITPGRKDIRLVITHCLAALSLPGLVLFFNEIIFSYADLTTSFLADARLMFAVCLYGFISIYLVQFVSPGKRWVIYFMTSLSLIFIAFSHLYFGSSGLISVTFGFLAGLFWVSVLGLALRRHAPHEIPMRRSHWLLLLSMSLLVMLTFPVFYSLQMPHIPVTKDTMYELNADNWKDTGWTLLPLARHDLRGYNRHPFNIQWAGNEDTLSKIMQKEGWHRPKNSKRQFVQWLNPLAEIHQLYVMPHVHNGEYESQLWIKPINEDSMFALRLWKSNFMIANANEKDTLFYGTVSTLKRKYHWGLTYLHTQKEFENPLKYFIQANINCQFESRINHNNELHNSDNSVVLISQCELN